MAIDEPIRQSRGTRKYNDGMRKALALREILSELNKRNALVVVEGPRDSEAIRSLGYNGKLFEVCGVRGGMGRLVIETDNFKTIVPLFDFDKGGQKLERGLKARLNANGQTIDYFVKKRIKSIMGDLAHIEDLKRFAYF